MDIYICIVICGTFSSCQLLCICICVDIYICIVIYQGIVLSFQGLGKFARSGTFSTWQLLCICICIDIYLCILIFIFVFVYYICIVISGPGQVCKVGDLQHLAAPLPGHLPCPVIPLHPHSTHLLILQIQIQIQIQMPHLLIFRVYTTMCNRK